VVYVSSPWPLLFYQLVGHPLLWGASFWYLCCTCSNLYIVYAWLCWQHLRGVLLVIVWKTKISYILYIYVLLLCCCYACAILWVCCCYVADMLLLCCCYADAMLLCCCCLSLKVFSFAILQWPFMESILLKLFMVGIYFVKLRFC
jgi:hypothetical protein